MAAVLWINEYSNWVNSPNSDLPVPQEPPLATQRFTAGAETKSAVLNVATKIVRLTAPSATNDGVAFIVGVAPTVTPSTGTRLLANQSQAFGVPQGTNIVISFVSCAANL